jgi:hypothetical protein
MNHAHEMAKQRISVPSEIEAEGPEGDAARAAVGKAAYDLNVQQYCCGGLNFGYYYDRSSLIIYDEESPPPYGMADFTASTVPGCRLPHFWLSDGRSLYDALAADYTLVRFDPSVEVGGLLGEARRVGVPIVLLDIDRALASDAYRHQLVLVRPDQHIAWRGDAGPADPSMIVDAIRGGASPGHERAVA